MFKMATMVAILKFNRHGIEPKLRWIHNPLVSISKVANIAAILKIFKYYLLPNLMLDWTDTNGGRHPANIEIHNCSNLSVPISNMAALAATLKLYKGDLLAICGIEPKLLFIFSRSISHLYEVLVS